MKKIVLFTFSIFLFNLTFAQSPQGFNYQAVIHSSEGEPLANHDVNLRISLLSDDESKNHYSETHSITTNPHGVVNLIVGGGTVVSGSFAQIPWSENSISLKVEVDIAGGSNYGELGTTKLLAVPYALVASSSKELTTDGTQGQILYRGDETWEATDALFVDSDKNLGIGTTSPSEKLEVTGNVLANQFLVPKTEGYEDMLFAVRNSNNEIVFAVFESGVRIYVDDYADEGNSKSTRSGFAIGGLTEVNKEEGPYLLQVNREGTTIRFDDDNSKSTRSGFAIGGLTEVNKEDNYSYMSITPQNYLIGQDAGKSLNGGLHNSFMGYKAGEATTSGNRNIFIGEESGQGNTTGNDNIYLGRKAGFLGQSGNFNMFFGNESGYSIDEGQHNIALGWKAGHGLTDGEHNIFIGNQSGLNNAGDAFYGSYNIFVGYNSGQDNTQGFKNIFFGYESGFKNYDGWANIFLGEKSGYENISGFRNVFIGLSTGEKSVEGGNNVYLGYEAGANKTEGSYNTFLGSGAGLNNGAGSNNVFVGYGAGYTISGSNKLAIANTTSSVPLIYGEFNNKKIGINTQNPTASLNIVGAYTGDEPEGVYIDLHNNSGSAGLVSTNRSGIRFKNVAETTNSYHKAGIFFQRNANHGRGNLIFAINDLEDDSNVTPDDVTFVINRNKYVGIGLAEPLSPLQVRGINTTTNGSSGVFIDVENFISTTGAEGTLSGIRFKNNTTYGSTSNYLGAVFFEKGSGFIGDLVLATSPDGNNVSVAHAGIRIKNTGRVLMPKLREVTSSIDLLPLYMTEEGEIVKLNETKSTSTAFNNGISEELIKVIGQITGDENLQGLNSNEIIPLMLWAIQKQQAIIDDQNKTINDFETRLKQIEDLLNNN